MNPPIRMVSVPPNVSESIAFNLCSLHDFDPAFVQQNERFALATITEYLRAQPAAAPVREEGGAAQPTRGRIQAIIEDAMNSAIPEPWEAAGNAADRVLSEFALATREEAPAAHGVEPTAVLQSSNGPVGVDASIAPIVQALWNCGLMTVASCSGHTHRPGNIALADGRELIIARNYDEARKIDALFPLNICGEEAPAEAGEDAIKAACVAWHQAKGENPFNVLYHGAWCGSFPHQTGPERWTFTVPAMKQAVEAYLRAQPQAREEAQPVADAVEPIERAIAALKRHISAIQAAKQGGGSSSPITDCINGLPGIVRWIESGLFNVEAAFEHYEATPPAPEAEKLRAVEALEAIEKIRSEMVMVPIDSEAANAWANALGRAADMAAEALAALQQEGRS